MRTREAPDEFRQSPASSFVFSFRMDAATNREPKTVVRNEGTSETVAREGSRLRDFIRRRVPDPRDAEDLLQDVFAELAEANQLLMPIEHVTGWLFRVARNRIVDLFRRKKPERPNDDRVRDEEGEHRELVDLLPSPEAGPEAEFERAELLEEIVSAIATLPKISREVFIAHEIEGRSFREIAATTGINVNTLLGRKRAAVLRLRELLQDAYDERNESRRRES